jgi:hypothetical protein
MASFFAALKKEHVTKSGSAAVRKKAPCSSI